jgi:hypothetical protein
LKLRKIILLAFALSTPFTALASGGFIIPSLVINLAWIIVIAFVIIGTKIKGKGKAILFISYLATIFLMFFFFSTLNALEDIQIINYCSAITPPLAFYALYRLISPRYKLNEG